MPQKVENKETQMLSPPKAPSIRRRNQRSHQAILKATAELLEEKGYRDICIEAIAPSAVPFGQFPRAGVGKQTIYRWWPSKAAVVMEAYSEKLRRIFPHPIQVRLNKTCIIFYNNYLQC
ncbi:TetR/AcrR family transcriptional regulator [Scytonema sp. PRP1]|uniref:TetR/AcrR family transcriptional regulator n=1 Tax=Scytonema sp. PRP1 TaxID=3120513 RepID=UPI00300C53C9